MYVTPPTWACDCSTATAQGVLLAGCSDEEEWQHLLDMQARGTETKGAAWVGRCGLAVRLPVAY